MRTRLRVGVTATLLAGCLAACGETSNGSAADNAGSAAPTDIAAGAVANAESVPPLPEGDPDDTSTTGAGADAGSVIPDDLAAVDRPGPEQATEAAGVPEAVPRGLRETALSSATIVGEVTDVPKDELAEVIRTVLEEAGVLVGGWWKLPGLDDTVFLVPLEFDQPTGLSLAEIAELLRSDDRFVALDSNDSTARSDHRWSGTVALAAWEFSDYKSNLPEIPS